METYASVNLCLYTFLKYTYLKKNFIIIRWLILTDLNDLFFPF